MTLASEAPQNKHQTLGQKSDAYKKMSVFHQKAEEYSYMYKTHITGIIEVTAEQEFSENKIISIKF